MGIYCSCNVIFTAAVEQAIIEKQSEIGRSHTLLDAVGVVYREARDKGSDLDEPIVPSCTGCFNHIGKDIQQATGLFEGEKLPPRTFDPETCPRQAQCISPAPANSNIMDNGAVAPCLSGPAVATL